jgi:signal transduction histidine kinase
MRIGIRTKLLTTYILASVIPVVVTLALLSAASAYFNSKQGVDDPQLSEYGAINLAVNLIYDNYEAIGNYDKFYEKTMTGLKGENNRIIIVDRDNRVLFDSEDREASISHRTYEPGNIRHYDVEFSMQNKNMIRFVMPLIVDDEFLGKMELTLNKFQFSMDIVKDLLRVVIGILVIGIILLIFLIVLFTSLVSKGVIQPLRQLSEAAESIAEGNLNAEIKYKNNDELGRFCRVFDTMRVKLKESLEKQADYENARKELVASISHDLRTPITSIKGYVEAIQDGVVNDKGKHEKYLQIIKDKTDKLDRLIDDLFQFSQLELGKLKMDLKKVNSRDLMENILEGYFFEFENLNISFSVEEPIPSVTIGADEHFVSRVFDNILQNSKRYIDTGGSVNIKSMVQNGYFLVAISDNGRGIKSEDLPNIFNRFYRGEKSRSRLYGGAGLGLAICKQIIEDHGGKIWVESIYGKGSTFYFSIPVA